MKRFKNIIIVLAIVAGVVIIIGALFVNKAETGLKKLKETKIENIDLSQLKDGIYKGKYDSFPVSAEVNVKIENHVITEIELIKHNNGKGQAAEIIPSKVVEAQSLEVDAISGATYSSMVILKAIENALKLY